MSNRRQSTGTMSPRRDMKVITNLNDSLGSPGKSRYGRCHKPKMQDDYVSTDKKVSAYLKLSPCSQIQYVKAMKEPKKRSPKKSPPEGSPRRGRPPKLHLTPKKEEDITKIVVKAEPQDPSERVDGCEWMVGDLAWGRVGQHPFWPCMIAVDPVHKIFTKTVRKGRATTYSQRFMHVQFFGDNGRRSWLNTTAVMSFNGRDAFLQLGETILAGMRKKEPKQTSAFTIKPAVIQVWEKAVQEAEDLISATREERIAFFAKHFPPAPVELTKEKILEHMEATESPQTPPKKRGRKRKAEQTPTDQESKVKQMKLEESVEKVEKSEEIDSSTLLSTTPRTIADRKKRQALLMQIARSSQSPPEPSTSPKQSDTTQKTKEEKQSDTPKQVQLKRPSSNESSSTSTKKKPKRKYVKKVSADFQAFSAKHFDRVADDHPELNDKEVNKYLMKMWDDMDDTQKARYKSRFTGVEKEESESESSEVASSEAEEEVPSSKSSSPAPLAAPTQKTSAIKRNNYKNLFYGAKSEKVCQICEKTGETVRCRGPCQSFYHPQCVVNPPTPSPAPETPRGKGKRGRPKKSVNAESIGSSTPVSAQSSQTTESKESPPVVESTVEEKETEPKSQEEKEMNGGKGSVSSEEGEGFRCKDCQEGRTQPCFVCGDTVHKVSEESKLYRCNVAYCGKSYHEECLKPWPQSSWRTNGNGKGSDRGVLTCPQHTCHTCASDNPGVIKARYNNDKLVRCVRCPTTYHHGNYCLPAGSEILTNSQIICPRHYTPSKKGMLHHVNAAWCFICASGGSLICCDLCPTSFHADCLNIPHPDGSYVCEDCQTGRFPLYGEIVWVKLGVYRWWPAQILYPALIPDNILNLPHVRGEFAVKFFGSHDHYWINRGRVFIYQDGDSGNVSYKKNSVDHTYERAVKEASEAQRKYLEEKATRDAEVRPGMKPPPYVKLKTNKPVGNVKAPELNVSSLTPCDCDPDKDNPCAPDSDCLNRILLVECNPQVCPAGDKCHNQMFEKRLYPPLTPYHTQGRGWGLKTLVALKKGDFVIEYVGEMIDEEEYKRRLSHMHENNEENFYFLTIDKDRLLDAGPKGNVARFMNHSCQPNCETQKWTVNGDTRVGLFALEDIPADTELVFNYNLESTGSDKKPCMCGAPNCSGFIGVKVTKNVEKEENKDKKVLKKKKSHKESVTKAHEEECFVCGEGGELLLCDGKHCLKGYHLSCLNKKQRPQGYWLCPWHQCNICNKGRVQRCSFCVNSFCQEHAEGNIRLDDVRGLVCNKHLQEDSENSAKSSKNSKSQKDTSKCDSAEMEVDSNTPTSPAIGDSQEKPESSNINATNSVSSAQRRSRRSRSNADATSNYSGEKLSKRKSRPLSVDENLINSSVKLSDDKTQSEIASNQFKEPKVEPVNDKDNNIVSDEKKEIPNITPNDSCEVETETISQSELKEQGKEKETINEGVSVVDIEPMEVDEEPEDNEDKCEIEEINDLSEACDESETKTNEADKSTCESDEFVTEAENVSETIEKEIVEQGIQSSEATEGKADTTNKTEEAENTSEVVEHEIQSSGHLEEEERTNPLDTVEKTAKQEERVNDSSVSEDTKNLVVSEEDKNENLETDFKPKTDSDIKPGCESKDEMTKLPIETENIEISSNETNGVNTDEETNETHQEIIIPANTDCVEESISSANKDSEVTIKTDEPTGNDALNTPCEENGKADDEEVTETKTSIELNGEKITLLEDLEQDEIAENGKKLEIDELCNGQKSEDVDEEKRTQLSDDDFELTYSECSNDKIINNPESSIELKVTDCTSDTNTNGTSDLVNGIETSTRMEVA